jgi:hypothetical protein
VRAVLALVALLASAAPLRAQIVATTFGFADDASFGPATFEVEAAAGVVPCGSVAVVGAERVCTATISRAAAQSIRVRGRVLDCDHDANTSTPPIAECIGGWSSAVVVPAGARPGPFTVTFARPLGAAQPGEVVQVTWDTPSVFNVTSAASSFSHAHTVGSGSNRVAWMVVYSASGAGVSGTPTFGGSSVGSPILNFNGSPLFADLKVYRVIAPSSGSQTFAGNFSSATNYTIVIISGDGIDQATPNDTIDTDTTGNHATTCSATTASAVGDEVVDIVATGFVTGAIGGTPGGSQTLIANAYNNGASNEFALAMSRKAGAASVTQTWDFSPVTDVGFYQVQMNVNAASGGGVATIDGWGPRLAEMVRRPPSPSRYGVSVFSPLPIPNAVPALAKPVYPDWVPRRPTRIYPTGAIVPQNFAAPAAPDLSWQPTYPSVVQHLARRGLLTARQPFYTADRFDPPAAPTVVPLSWRPVYPDRIFQVRRLGPAGWPFRSDISPNAFALVVVTPPPSTTFAEWLAEVVVERTVLCELQPAESLAGFAAVGGATPNVYSIAWATLIDAATVPGGVYRRLDEVRINNVSLTLRASVALVNANLGSYFYVEGTSTLYVSSATGSDPDTFASVAAFFSLFVATTAKDFVGGQLWEPRLTGELPTVSSSAEDPFTPAKVVADGSIVLLNAAAPFDQWAKRYVWKNKRATLRLGGGLMTEAQFERVQTMRIEAIAVNDDVATLTVRSMASVLEQTVPLHTLGADSYPNLAEGLEGTYKPILYGLVRDIPAPCVNAYIRANPDPLTWPATGFADVYLVADPAVQVLTGVLGVRGISKTTGETITLDPTQYTVDLANCTVTVTAATASSHAYDIRIDATGETDGAGGYLDTFGEIARDLLQVLGEPLTAIETTTFAAADTGAPFALGLWLREGQQASEVFTILQQSVLGGLWIDRAGQWRAYVLDAATEPPAVAALADADFVTWQHVDRIDPIYPLVRLYFAHNLAAETWQVTTASDDETGYLNETTDALAVYTALVSPSDATNIAQRYRLLASSPDTWIDTDQRGLALMTAELFDRVTVTRARAPHTSGALCGTADGGPRLREEARPGRREGAARRHLRHFGNHRLDPRLGRRSPTPPDYATSSAAQRDANAYWHDASGEVVAGVANHSVWW